MEQKDILNSWKEISDYLDRNVRTCQRWEIELGLPVNRIDQNSEHSKVFAYKLDIDQWLKEKAESKEIKTLSFLQSRWSVTSLVSILVSLSAIFLFLLFTNRISISPQPEYYSFAVLPFENLNPSQQDKYFSEGMTNEIINKKLKKALEAGLTPIVCVGEKLEEREAGKTEKVVEDHIKGAFEGLNEDKAKKVIIAYAHQEKHEQPTFCLTPDIFIGRLLSHVPQYVVRAYGLFHFNCREKLNSARKLLDQPPYVPSSRVPSALELLKQMFADQHIGQCPYCNMELRTVFVYRGGRRPDWKLAA